MIKNTNLPKYVFMVNNNRLHKLLDNWAISCLVLVFCGLQHFLTL